MSMADVGDALKGVGEYGSSFNIADSSKKNPFKDFLPTLGAVSYGNPDLLDKLKLLMFQSKIGVSPIKDRLMESQIKRNDAYTSKLSKSGTGGGGGVGTKPPSLY